MGEELEIKEPVGGEVEKKATPPSSVSDAFNKFQEKQAAAKEKPAVGTQPPKEGDKTVEPPAKKIRFVDEEGKEVPFQITVDGKIIDVTDPEKLKTYGQLGYHSDTRGKALNDRELAIKEQENKLSTEMATLTKGQEMLGKIQKAIEEGRLTVNPSGSSPAGDQAPEIDEELFADPGMIALKKENIETQKSLKSMKEQLETTNKILLGKLVEEQHGKIVSDMDRLKPQYGLADENDVWDLLALQDEKGKPVHNTESAMKLSSEKEQAKFDAYNKVNPDFAKLSDEEKKEVIKEYLEKKANRENVNVSSPSGSPAGDAPTGKVDKSKWTSRQHFEAGAQFLTDKMAAARKS